MPAFTPLRDSFVPFDGRHAAYRNHRLAGDLSAAERATEDEVTLVLRENPAGPSIDEILDLQAAKPLAERRDLSDAQLAANHGAGEADWRRVARWAASRGLIVVPERSDKAGRRLRVRGTVARLDAAFGTRSKQFEWTRRDGTTVPYRRTLAAPVLPSDIADAVVAVQGLSKIPFQPRFRALHPAATPKQVYAPEDLARLYNFPQMPNGGAGMVINIGIAELGGVTDPRVAAFFFGDPKYKNCTMTEFSVNGAPMTPDPNGADIEVYLDWQTALRTLVEAAPEAKINIFTSYGANTDQGFADAWNVFVTGQGITSAVQYSAANPKGSAVDPKTVDPTTVAGVSTSWGQNESGWAAASIQAMDQVAGAGALKGVFFANASGDNGAADSRTDGKLDADAPSLCANVLAVGGTQLNSSNGQVTSEPVWNESLTQQGAGGGGVSRLVGVPGYQQAAGISIAAADDGHAGRVEPDLALNADPTTGYDVVYVDSAGTIQHMTVGGTSASTPLATAGLTLVSALLGKKLGRVQDTLYTLAAGGTGVRDVTQGNNAYPAGTAGYNAGPGFDAASGWGSFDFSALAQAWAQTVPAPALRSRPTPPAVPTGKELS